MMSNPVYLINIQGEIRGVCTYHALTSQQRSRLSFHGSLLPQAMTCLLTLVAVFSAHPRSGFDNPSNVFTVISNFGIHVFLVVPSKKRCASSCPCWYSYRLMVAFHGEPM